VYFRDPIGKTLSVYSEGAGIVSIEPVEDPKGRYMYPTEFPGDLDLAGWKDVAVSSQNG